VFLLQQTLVLLMLESFMPISRKKDFESKEDFVLSNYPTLFAAAQNAGLR
jgi:hypothetical protein